jgi:hypothetical protein
MQADLGRDPWQEVMAAAMARPALGSDFGALEHLVEYTHPKKISVLSQDRVHKAWMDEARADDNEAAEETFKNVLRNHGVFTKDVVDDAEYQRALSALEDLYARPGMPQADADRPHYMARGNLAHLARDPFWTAFSTPDGFLPLYRATTSSYGRPDAPPTPLIIEGSSVAGTSRIEEFEALLFAIRPFLAWGEARSGFRLNHIVLHRYLNERDGIGMHTDKTQDILPGSCIFSFSLGAARPFQIATNKESSVDMKTRFLATPNSAVCLPYNVNMVYQHGVPHQTALRDAGAYGVRYSITARTIQTYYNAETGEQRVLNADDLRI